MKMPHNFCWFSSHQSREFIEFIFKLAFPTITVLPTIHRAGSHRSTTGVPLLLQLWELRLPVWLSPVGLGRGAVSKG